MLELKGNNLDWIKFFYDFLKLHFLSNDFIIIIIIYMPRIGQSLEDLQSSLKPYRILTY